ncbi:hypothetical protein EJ08DRAFT_644700 [Tothia fuscella]|uniref:HD domain-containing protein n=1 Tax=Tothia fuscella TaxID=1048955 RepID=A0A9P4U3V1_9PEZI|nr:hypothetical protein EJ08DRAFT_644700 [Tothia fuscella]
MNSIIFSSLFLLNLFSPGSCYPSELPHQTLVGVSVVDTPIVRDAFSYAKDYENSSVFNHSIRSWIFGSIIVNKNPAYTKIVDKEVHALGTILHDIGFDPKVGISAAPDPNHPAIGGAAVRKFLANHTEGKTWTESRVQLLIDSVTLHLQDSDMTKAPEIRAVRDGQQIDLTGKASGFVTPAEYASVVAAYPLGDMKAHLEQGHGDTGNAAGHAMSSGSGHQMSSPDSKMQGHGM